jgi:hypothetical protein
MPASISPPLKTSFFVFFPPIYSHPLPKHDSNGITFSILLLFAKEEPIMEKNQVSELLIRIGANPSYRGFPYLTYVIWQAASGGNGPFLSSKALYRDAAECFHVSPDSIQHSIRTLLNAYWMQDNGKHFCHITGYPNSGPLPPKEFIAVLADYLQRTRP